MDSLNLSKNSIKKIESLGSLTKLNTLNLANNYLKTSDDIAAIVQVPSLAVLDIQSNRIDDIQVLDYLERLPNLKVLYLQGNPFVKEIRNYRKAVLSRLTTLTYLDDRPVFEDERRRVAAWDRGMRVGGVDAANAAEREEVDAIRAEKKARDDANFEAFGAMMRVGRAARAAREAEEELRRSRAAAGMDFGGHSGINSPLNSLSEIDSEQSPEQSQETETENDSFSSVNAASFSAEVEHATADHLIEGEDELSGEIEDFSNKEETDENRKSGGINKFTRELIMDAGPEAEELRAVRESRYVAFTAAPVTSFSAASDLPPNIAATDDAASMLVVPDLVPDLEYIISPSNPVDMTCDGEEGLERLGSKIVAAANLNVSSSSAAPGTFARLLMEARDDAVNSAVKLDFASLKVSKRAEVTTTPSQGGNDLRSTQAEDTPSFSAVVSRVRSSDSAQSLGTDVDELD